MLFTIGHYQVTEEIAVGPKSVIYRAVDGETGQTVILKTLRAEYPPLDDVVKMKREYEIAAGIDGDGIIRPLALLPFQNGVVQVQEDIDGVSLHHAIGGRPMSLGLFLQTAISLTEALGRLHSRRIVHKDIKPHNIIVNLDRGLVKITDFGIASQLTQERQELLNPDQLEGTLAYMSPEQTGRMNRKIDYRTDFYGLGVTLYEMLTGELPFSANDPVELIHCHIAKQPAPPALVNPPVPQPLSDIVLRLLAKNAEDRYQSAYGLKADLARCRELLEETGEIRPFPLGSADKSEIFNIPEKLYGREQDIATMRDAFRRVCAGGSEMLLVSGTSGIGKSFYVHELHKSVVREKGFFPEGKFDQFKRHLPYDALLQALKGLVHQLLTESAAQVAIWKDKLLDALGPNGQVLIDVIPELELILGPQPLVGALPPAETQHRFQLVMNRFLRVFANKEHPLVLFLDDLQWADLASLQLIESIMADESTEHLLFIGSYRDNEVSAEDRLMTLLQDLRQKGRPITEVRLTPFDLPTVTRLVADTLAADESVAPLAQLVAEKTKGNPFFVKQFLQGLYEQKHICFDSALGRWTWALEQIRSLEITDNVVEFMLGQVKKLPEPTQRVLTAAACIGNSFDLRTLAFGCDLTLRETADRLWAALEEGMIEPGNMGCKLLYASAEVASASSASAEQGTGSEMPEDFNPTFRFLHDRVQQVAHTLLEEEAKQAVHLKIGRLLLSGSPQIAQDDRLFEIVNHLNVGCALIDDGQERVQLARLNLLAGERAKKSTAYEPALRYLTQGADLLGDQGWNTHHDLLFTINRERSEVEYLCEHYEAAEQLFDLLIAKARTDLEKAQVYNIRVALYTHLSRFTEAIDVGLKAARLLGIRLSKRASKAAVAVELLKTYAKLRRYEFDELLNLPVDTDPARAEVLKIFLHITTAAFAFNRNLFALLILKAIDLSLKHGNNSLSAMGFGGFGILLCAIGGDYRKMYDYGLLGYRIDSKHGLDSLKARGPFGVLNFCSHWLHPVSESIELAKKCHQLAMETGDMMVATASVPLKIMAHLIRGDGLADVERECDTYFDFLVRTGFGDFHNNLHVLRGFLRNLRGEAKELYSFSEDGFDEVAYIRDDIHNDAKYSWCIYHHWKAKMYYLLGLPQEALAYSTPAEQDMEAIFGNLEAAELLFDRCLILTANYGGASSSERKAFAKTLRKHLKTYEKWVSLCPANYLHRFLLIQADWNRVQGKTQTACDLYEQCLEEAQRQNCTPVIALANELAALCYLGQGKPKIAKLYLQEARYNYRKWGAAGVVKRLESEHPGLLSAAHREAEGRTDLSFTTHTHPTMLMATTESRGQNIDVMTVMKASNAISGEIVLDKLLENLINIVVENAGAEKGCLMIYRGDELWIEAEKSVADGSVRVLQSIPYQQGDLASAVVRYAARTKEPLVLHEACKTGMFQKDPYIRDKQVKSILCLPLLNQGRLVGVLYLENNLAAYAFTSNRLEMMKMLSSQIAISIANAELYKQQLELNRAYGRFVPHQFLRFLQKKSIVDVKLGDHVQTEMSVVFTDIRNFTALSEQMTPKENFEFLNDYLKAMEPCVNEHHGFIDKYIGDSIMALFERQAEDAINASVAMLRTLKTYNAERVMSGLEPLVIGVGINTGLLMLGTLGGHHRMDSTVISDTVNLASRIEGLTKVYGASLLITEHTYAQLKDPSRFDIRLLDRVQVRGKTEEIALYEVFDADPLEMRNGKRRSKDKFEQAVEHYLAGEYFQAERLFLAGWRECPQDKTAQLFLERCAHLLEQEEAAPALVAVGTAAGEGEDA